jgi:HSP20 family molecular chaperone IbpA
MAQELDVAPDGTLQYAHRFAGARSPARRPAADIYETDDRVVLMLDMPSVSAESVDVSLERRVLTIQGHANPPAPEGYRQVYAEYDVRAFERVFTLSEDIDQDRIKAEQKHGVLRLELPKAATAKPRRIEVQAS